MHIPKFNSIRSVTSPIFAKEIFKIRAIAKPIPVYRGWVKTLQPWTNLVTTIVSALKHNHTFVTLDSEYIYKCTSLTYSM